MKKHLITITLIAAALLIGLAGAASAASVTVAASNSQVKSSAQYVCDGSNDQSEIQAAINQVASGGGNVYLLDGTFNVAGDIEVVSGVNLIGKGADSTTLRFVSEGWVQVDGSNTISDLQSTGPTGFLICGSHVRMTNVTVRNYTANKGAFYLYVFNRALTDITFTTCNAIDGWSHGFINEGRPGYLSSVSDITYSGCTAINCGKATRFDNWITGFDFAEGIDSISNLLVENCRAEGAWESGFHFEESPQKNNVILRNCVSINNGQKKNRENPVYASGFFGGGPSVQYIDCTSQNNPTGFNLRTGSTVIRGKDIGSNIAFRSTDYNSMVLTDCWSDQAQQWAFYGFNSRDVSVTNFKVTNPVGNPYPAILAVSSVYPSYNMNIQLAGTSAPSQPAETQTPVVQVTETQTPVVQAPVAQFRASVTSGQAPLTISFTDRSTGTPTSYLWKFGDGTTSTEKNPKHRYLTPGTFTVTEIVKNSAGSNTRVKTNLITVR